MPRRKRSDLPVLNVSHTDANAGNIHVKNRRQAENLDYLLGFSLPPRVNQRHLSAGQRPKSSSRQSVPYTRERFVHAQYRFVLNPTGDYTAHFSDPDIYHYWPNVLQVIVNCAPPSTSGLDTLSDRAEQENFCPICLCEPSAPRMSKCGHVYCYPCLLHLFELSDVGKWSKCPVCADTIHPKDLKSVTFLQSPEQEASATDSLQDSQYVTCKLMERPRITTLALPRSATWPSDALPPLATPWVFSPDVYTFARFMLATPEYMIAALNKDLAQLNALSTFQVGYAETDLDGSFVSVAKRKIGEQLEKAEGLKTPAVMSAKRQSAKDIATVTEAAQKRQDRLSVHQPVASTSAGSSSEDTDIPDIYYASSSPGGQYTPRTAATASSTPARTRKNLNPPPSDSSFYFYQAASGANVYLHPLDIKILKAHFENYSDFPDTIQVRVEAKEEGSMDEDLKRRCRYLGHLPAASDVTFLEVDLEPLVGSKSLEPYANALKQRRNKRKEKVKREDKAKAKSDEAERLRLERDFRTPVPSAQYSSADQPFKPDLILPPRYDANIDDDHFPAMAITPPSPSFMPVQIDSRNRTVWGTRIVAAQQAAPEAHDDPSASDRHWDAAWRQLENPTPVDTGGGNQRKKKKNKIVIRL